MTLLVNHPAPYPDESLASYVERLARANHYDPSGWLSAWLRETDSGGKLTFARAMRQPEFYRRLAQATGQPAARLFTLTHHRFSTVLLPPETRIDMCELEGQRLDLYPPHHVKLLRPETAAAYCPACLREALYHRLIWQAAAVAACPIHTTWLLDCCPVCEHSLTSRAVAVGCCPHCYVDLREHDALSVSLTDLGEMVLQAQQCLYAWLNGQAAPASLGLPVASGQTLFRVLDGLRIAVQLRGIHETLASGHGNSQSVPTTDVCRKLAPQAAGCLYGAALQGLKDWPDGFFAFLDAYRNHDQAAPRGLNRLGTLYSTWLEIYWQHPMFGFVQEAFNHYLTSHFPPVRSILQSKRLRQQPELVEQFAYVDVRNAARLTHTSPPRIKRLIRDGWLDVYPEQESSRPGVFLYREQVERLRDALAQKPTPPETPGSSPGKPRVRAEFSEDMLTKKEAASYLGIKIEPLNDLLAGGLLTPTGRCRRGEGHLPYLTFADLEAWQERLKVWVQLQVPPARGSVNLPKAAVLNGKVGMSQAKILERVLAGRLTAYHASPDLRPLSALWFDEAAVLGLTQQVKDENGWVGFMEAKALLDVGRQILHRWVDQGLIVSVASFARAQYFLRADVADLCERLVPSREVVLMLGTTRGALSEWVRAGCLQAVTGPGINSSARYLFDRTVLEDWQRTFISASEAKKMLGATNSMWWHWQRDGKLTRPLPDQKVSGFYRRDEVLALRDLLSDSDPVQKL